MRYNACVWRGFLWAGALSAAWCLTLPRAEADESFPEGTVVSVQVRRTPIRTSANHYSRVLAWANYGDQLRVSAGGTGGFVRVKAPGGSQGFVHVSAATARKVVLARMQGDHPSHTYEDGTDVVLAGKGFNKEIEDELRARDGSLNYLALDRIERTKVDETDLQKFVMSGGLQSKKS